MSYIKRFKVCTFCFNSGLLAYWFNIVSVLINVITYIITWLMIIALLVRYFIAGMYAQKKQLPELIDALLLS